MEAEAIGNEKGDFGMNAQMKKRFIELCLREVNAFGYKGRSMHTSSWDKVREEISLEFGVSFKHKDLKNKWHYLRGSYRTWRYLINKDGDAYNAANGTFSWPQSVWDDIIRQYPSTKKFKSKPLEYENELRALFEGTLTKGDIAFCPGRKKLPDDFQSCSIDLVQGEPEGEPINMLGSDPVTGLHSPSIGFEDVQVKSSIPTSEQGIQSDVGTSSSMGRRKRKLDCEDTDLKSEVRDLIALIKDQVVCEKAKTGPSIEDCMQVINGFLEEGRIDKRVYCGALVKFCECENYMKAFMGIKAVEHKVFFLGAMVGGI